MNPHPETRELIQSTGSTLLTELHERGIAAAEIAGATMCQVLLGAEMDTDSREEMISDLLAGCHHSGSPPAAALAAMLAHYLPDGPLSERAGELASELIRCSGAPSAIGQIGTAMPTSAFRVTDVYGDSVSCYVEFGFAGGEQHALVFLLDYTRGLGYIQDVVPVLRDEMAKAPSIFRAELAPNDGFTKVEDLAPASVLTEVATALARLLDHPELQAFADDDVFDLLPVIERRVAAANIAPLLPQPPLDEPTVNETIDEFLTSVPCRAVRATGMPEQTIRRYATWLALWGAGDPSGQLRVGPLKTAAFLFGEVHRRYCIEPGGEDAGELADVVRAWNAWRTAEEGLDQMAAANLVAATAVLAADFARGTMPDFDADDEADSPADDEVDFEDLPAGLLAALAGLEGPGFPDAAPIPAPTPEGAGKVIRVRVDLTGFRPPIWRRLVIPGQATLPEVHRALQIAFGWPDRYLHEFSDKFGGQGRYWVPPEALGRFATGTLDESAWEIQAILNNPGDKLEYLYDHADNWHHIIKVEAIEDGEANKFRCLAGRGATPFENSGTSGEGTERRFDKRDIARIDAELTSE